MAEKDYNTNIMEPVPQATNFPPRKGLTKVQKGIVPVGMPQDNCPCLSVCQKLGTYRQGLCFIGTNETHKCLVANNLLVAKLAGL